MALFILILTDVTLKRMGFSVIEKREMDLMALFAVAHDVIWFTEKIIFTLSLLG